MNTKTIFLFLLTFAFSVSVFGIESTEKWDIFEITLKGPSEGNPYRDVALSATFSNGEKNMEIHGFYDGEEEIEHDSFYEKSILKIPDHRQFENLSWLFPLGALLPGIFLFIKFLIKLPLGYMYKLIWHVSRCYGYFFRIHWIPLKDVIRAFLTLKVQGGMPGVEK